MPVSGNERRPVRATGVKVTRTALAVDLADGRTVTVPLGWYPRLAHGTSQERGRWRLIGGGMGIHWPDLDEDISVEGLLAGHPSGESQASLQRWLAGRTRRSTTGVRRTTKRGRKGAAGRSNSKSRGKASASRRNGPNR
jgi:hypothetical protein